MKKEVTGCCDCEEDFKNEVHELVEEVEGYTKADHEKKAREVKAAFGKKEGDSSK